MRAALGASLALLTACTAPPLQTLAGGQLLAPAGWSVADAAGAGPRAASASASAGGAGGDSGAGALADWWQRFDDPDLTALVQAALLANPGLQGAQAALQQAQALRDVAAAALWPSLGASASAQRGTAGGNSTGNRLQVGLDGSWGLDLFGARRAGINAAQASADASAASLGDVQGQLAAELALNYILLRTSQLRLQLASDNLASQQQTLQITLWRQQAGLVNALQAEQARAAVEQNQAQLPPLQTAIVQTRHALAVLTGQPPMAWFGLLDLGGRRAAVPPVRGGLAMAVPADTLRQRADVRAAEWQVAAALARVGQAQAQRWPSFAIGGSLALDAASFGALGQGSAVLGSLLASVALPVFDGGALRAQVRVQQAALAQAQQAYRAVVLGALQQVEDALVAQRGNRLRLASLRLAADAAGKAALLARQRYDSGLVDFQTVLETQRTLFATQDGVATASAELGGDQVRLFRALGGGWQPLAQADTP